MSFEGKSDEQIVNEQQASLDSKSSQYGSRSFDAGATDGSYESGVNESNLGEFEAPRGVPQTTVGRTGQTGGGTNPQHIPPEEGGYDRTGGSSMTYEGPAGDKYDTRREIAGAVGTGDFTTRGDGSIDAKTVQFEVVGNVDAPREPQLRDQGANPYDPNDG